MFKVTLSLPLSKNGTSTPWPLPLLRLAADIDFIAADIVVPGTVMFAILGEIIWKGIFCVAWVSYPPVDLVSLKYNLGLLAALEPLDLSGTVNGNPVCAAVKAPVLTLTV